MNKTLFKATLRANWLIGLFITLMLIMYTSIAITMFDPESADMVEGMLKMIPKGMIKAFGFSNLGTELTGYISSYLYGFIYIIFPVIYSVIVANKLIAKHVDSGSMAYLLTTPNSRIKIAITQAIYLASSIAIIFIINIVIGIILSESMFSGLLKIDKYLSLNLITYLVILAVSSIGFFFSCLFNETKYSLAFGGGVPLIFLVIKMLSELNTDLEWMRYMTLYSFINIDKILESSGYVILSSSIILVISLIFYILGIIIFNRKSLSI
ncbi:ABC transporter permease subunit [Clostridium sp. D2Q-11]|uniref:ABC transporter permease subunit n=1 Tax=Anaeromonas frigoriresistens TaxID=2683708 RepID=A0A942Z9I6_9FIRM|nr:ABC transporter permease subunit [Anaeromonas frigoriresistens]MBS4539363.1 ABC transporter permease subunit [Anaeromonas frigoriresistens]